MKESYKAYKESGKAYENIRKACEESGKAYEKGRKAPCKNTSKPPFWKRIFCFFGNSLLEYSKSLFQKGSLGGQCQFLCF